MKLAAKLFFLMFVTLALLELVVILSEKGGLLTVPPPPPPDARFWDGNHPVFGVWHQPNAVAELASPCYRARYQANSVGARDRERTKASTRSRTIVLGDSFIEGWGLPVESRLSNLLESGTGIEHLNFGMSHFSPYQSFLVYRELASDFDHDAVIVGVTPENDFLDLDLERSRQMEDYQFMYRPYLVSASEGSEGYEHRDFRENSLHRLLRRHSYAFRASQSAFVRMRNTLGNTAERPTLAVPRGYSAFADFSDADLGRLAKSLELLIAEAEGKRVAVVLIPVLNDLLRSRSQSSDQLTERLTSRLEHFENVEVVSLIPALLAAGGAPRKHYFSCDYHWNVSANRLAARYLEAVLTSP